MISVNYKFISEITIENQIVDQKNLFSIGFSPEINGYLMAVLVCWIAHYERYYSITEYDYYLYQTDKEIFYDKYQKELSQIKNNCFTENFTGACALRDYDGARNFHHAYPSEKNPFQGYLYYQNILYARIVWESQEIYVPPVQAIQIDENNFRFPLRDSCCLMKDEAENPICYKLNIKF